MVGPLIGFFVGVIACLCVFVRWLVSLFVCSFKFLLVGALVGLCLELFVCERLHVFVRLFACWVCSVFVFVRSFACLFVARLVGCFLDCWFL